MSNEVSCPKCSSTSLSANKKGFSGKKAVAGAVLTGGLGLLAGTIGSNKIKITCLNCGYQFAPGDQQQRYKTAPMPARMPTEAQQRTNRGVSKFLSIIIGFIAALMIISFIIDPGFAIFIIATILSLISYLFWKISKPPLQ